MAEIILSNSEKIIRLSSEQIARTFSPFSWKKIRLGMRVRINASASLSDTNFYFGLCNMDGPGGFSLDSDCELFVGAKNKNLSWAYDGPNLVLENQEWYLLKKINSSLSFTGDSISNLDITTNPDKFSAIFLDIEKTSLSEIEMRVIYPQTEATASINIEEAIFKESMEQESIASAGGVMNGYSFYLVSSFPYNESNEKALNGINIGWSSIETMDIASISLSRIK